MRSASTAGKQIPQLEEHKPLKLFLLLAMFTICKISYVRVANKTMKISQLIH